MVLATVPEAAPTRRNQRATSWPAPISANDPKIWGSRLMESAFWWVSIGSEMDTVWLQKRFERRPSENANTEDNERGLAVRSSSHSGSRRACTDPWSEADRARRVSAGILDT